MNFKVRRKELADGFIGGTFHGRGLHLYLETSVRLWRYGFPLAAGMYFDIDFHKQKSRDFGRG